MAGGMKHKSGLAVVVLAIPRGLKRERYGSWDRFIR